MSVQASGLAASIRGSTESDTFDLAGQSVSTIATTIRSALDQPLPISHMIRITLIVGAGKVGRQKYDENAAKAVTSALKEVGFEEDRGASCIPDCAGTFKLQHDTGKNLKTVVVFPKIIILGPTDSVVPSGGGESLDGTTGVADGGPTGSISSSRLMAPGSPREMIALSSTKALEGMIKSHCPTWSQKKECLAEIAELLTTLHDLEAKLVQGVSLSDPEQAFYENVSATVLEEKQTLIKDQMHQMVDDGRITTLEKSLLLAQVNDRLEVLAKERDEAEKNGQSKKVEKLKNLQEKAEARKEKLSKIPPKPDLPPLKHHAEIFKLRSELKPLLELEEGARGRLLSIKETQTLARKDEILAKIADLEEKSRGWFEEDDRFQARVDACSAAWAAQNTANKKKGASQKPTSSASTNTSRSKNAWVTSSSIRPQGGGGASMSTTSSSGGASKKKSSSKGSGGVFAAMMLDSDSD